MKKPKVPTFGYFLLIQKMDSEFLDYPFIVLDYKIQLDIAFYFD